MKLPLLACSLLAAVVAWSQLHAADADSVKRELGAAEPDGTLRLTTPVDYQVTQRETADHGRLVIAGELNGADASTTMEARLIGEKDSVAWTKLDVSFDGPKFSAILDARAGGWFRAEVRASSGDHVLGEASVEHVGIGEVFVVAGQSNSANHGEEKQMTQTGRVASCLGEHWQLANDPQPGASGKGGSFLPPFGDAMVEKFGVPIGFVPCGIGATSVREWLPNGAVFPNPPTIERRVQQRPDGQWESKGEAFAAFIDRMSPFGPHGFRAVLWHQGESDANQRDLTRTLPGKLYREYLEQVIEDSRRQIGWPAPWFVAQVSYHLPSDEESPDIRAAQASLWADGIALEGPDSDAIRGTFRQNNGQGVHFSGPGLREHAARWAEKVAPWLEQQLKSSP